MDKQNHLMAWDKMRMRHGITLRLLEQIPADQLTRQPIAGMRTPVQLIVHMYATADGIAGGVVGGAMAAQDEAALAAEITTPGQLRAFVDKTWASADRKAREVTDAQLAASVSTPWGKSYPGFALLGFIHDEYQHHRGQLYAYVRTYGVEPVMVWDFEHNAPEFQPRQHASA